VPVRAQVVVEIVGHDEQHVRPAGLRCASLTRIGLWRSDEGGAEQRRPYRSIDVSTHAWHTRTVGRGGQVGFAEQEHTSEDEEGEIESRRAQHPGDTRPLIRDRLDYYFEVQRFDRDLGHIIETLERAGELDNTILIVTSDNGMPFPRAKANVYDGGARVPLAIRWPGRPW
jgi:hypothetical protein